MNIKTKAIFLVIMILIIFSISGEAKVKKSINSVGESAQSLTPSPCFSMGDANNDGDITASDALIVLRIAVGQPGFTEDQINVSDVDGNGEVTASDALLVLRYAVGNTDTFSVCNINFITFTDTHVTSNTSQSAYTNFTEVVNYINTRNDVDFVVHLGDIVDTGSVSNLNTAKSIISNLNVPYYVIKGNHDGTTSSNFENTFGPSENLTYKKIYQLIFVGIGNGPDGLFWSFDYSRANKSRPTLIFNHGPVQPPPGSSLCDDWAKKGAGFNYSCSMLPNVDSFSNLLGYYDGHVHNFTQRTMNGSLFTSEDNIGGFGPATNYIGYTEIRNGKIANYTRLKYR